MAAIVAVLVAVLAAGSVLAALSAPVGAIHATQTSVGHDVSTPATASLAPTAPPTNNTTHHRNPDTVDESGDLQAIERWLGGRMGERLGESTLQLTQAEYQQARALLGDDYDSHLERYVDVAGETADSADDSNAETYERTKSTQREYVSTVEEYREQRDAYETARENGETERARRLARNLSRQATRIERLGATLTEQYAEIESFSDTDLGPATARIQDITENVSATTERIVEREFVETTLSIDTASASASFSDPLRVSGQVQPENDSADPSTVENGTVLLQLGPQTARVDVGPNGRFEATIRPTLVPRGEQELQAEYVPPEAAVFLGANRAATVQIRPVTPTVTVEADATTVRYGDTVTVRASVVVNETPVSSVPAEIQFGSRRVASGRTTETGVLVSQLRVPATIPAGNQSMRAVLPFEGRAIEASSGETRLVVEESPTTLSLSDAGDTVQGRLVTDDRRPVSGLPVTLEFPDETRVVETNSSGWYRAALPVSDAENRTVPVDASFDGANTNLESSTVTGRVVLPTESGGDGTGAGDDAVVERVVDRVVDRVGGLGVVPRVVGLLVLFVIAGGTVWYARRDSDTSDETAGAGADSSDAESRAASEQESPSEATEPRFAAAESKLAEGEPTAAILALYPAIRGALGREDADATRTHWEFLDAFVGREPDAAAQLRAVTELYERAAFANESIDEQAARRALADARDILAVVNDTGDATTETGDATTDTGDPTTDT